MIRTTDRPIFLVRVGSLCGGIWWGLEDEQVIRISRGMEKGVEIERRKGSYGMKTFTREFVSSSG